MDRDLEHPDFVTDVSRRVTRPEPDRITARAQDLVRARRRGGVAAVVAVVVTVSGGFALARGPAESPAPAAPTTSLGPIDPPTVGAPSAPVGDPEALAVLGQHDPKRYVHTLALDPVDSQVRAVVHAHRDATARFPWILALTTDGFATTSAFPLTGEYWTLRALGGDAFAVTDSTGERLPRMFRGGREVSLRLTAPSALRPGEVLLATTAAPDGQGVAPWAVDPLSATRHRLPEPAAPAQSADEVTTGASGRLVAAEYRGRMWWSNDGGARWAESHPSSRSEEFMAVAPGTTERWCYATTDGQWLTSVWRSDGTGGSWQRIEVPGRQQPLAPTNDQGAAVVLRDGVLVVAARRYPAGSDPLTDRGIGALWRIAEDGTLHPWGDPVPGGINQVDVWGPAGQIVVSSFDNRVYASPDGTDWVDITTS